MTEDKKIIVITKRSIPENIYHEAHTVSSVDLLPEDRSYAVILDIHSNSWFDELVQIRQHVLYQLVPLFYWGETMSQFEQLFDGSFEQNFILKANEIQSRIELIPDEAFANEAELLLLRYLFCRKGFILKGHFTHNESSGFDYPLLRVLFQKSHFDNSWHFLQSMVSRNLLKHGQAVDELQLCPHCESGLLNFKNCCPNCQSVDITTQHFVHCFTCGNIGPISAFLKHDQLSCERCNSSLRHIGIDYDKPLEDKLCNHCKFYFFEPEVTSICMVCLQLTKPTELVTRKLHEYSIDRRGKQLVRGKEQEVFQHLEHFFKMIDYHSFTVILNWQIQLSKRHEHYFFTLIIIKVINLEHLIKGQGILKAEKNMEQFFDRLRCIFRHTDIATREDNALLFFLPLTQGENEHLIIEKIEKFMFEQASNHHDIPLKIELGSLHSSEIIANDLNDQIIISELFNRVRDYE
jgi:hypothetical protein